MKIIADKAIPYAKRFFSTLGDVVLLDAGDITHALISDADCLVVRSVTRVDRGLLHGTQVSCVASASSGTDHADLDYLDSRNITLFDVKGCNANSVAEYVLSCLFILSEQYGVELEGKTAGIIGRGHVGARLGYLLQVIGIETRVYDPFIRDKHNSYPYRDLDQVLSADVVSLHVPFTTTGEFPTAKMVGREFLGKLKEDVIFVNTARGGVVNEQALIDFARENRASRLVLDVWDNEPDINIELLNMSALATPHVAGYSARGKLNATRMVCDQVCAWAGAPAMAADDTILPGENMELDLSGIDNPMEAVRLAALACYDVRTDCAAFREIETVAGDSRSEFFTSARTGYPFRREFPDLRVILSGNDAAVHEKLSGMGFDIRR
jgi:erythronate-4-phosphate dehydrogenase